MERVCLTSRSSEANMAMAAAGRGLELVSPHHWRMQALRKALVPTGDAAAEAGSTFNLVNSVVGSGILGMPEAMSFTGVVPFLLILALSAYLCRATSDMLVRVAVSEGAPTYGDAAERVAGRRAATVLHVAIVGGNLGSLIAYFVLLGDFSEIILDDTDREFWIAAAGLLVILPLCLKRDLNDFVQTSVTSVLFVGVFIVCFVVRSSERVDDLGASSDVESATFSADFFRAIPVAFFALNAHTAVVPIFRSMKRQEVGTWKGVSAASFGAVTTVYALVAVLGYVAFGDDVEGNILKSFDDRLMKLVTALVAFTIIFTFPIVHFALRLSLHHLLRGDSEMGEQALYTETYSVVGVSLVVGLLVKDVSLVFGFTGSLAAGIVTFIFPAWLFLRSERVRRTPFDTRLAKFTVVFGVVSCVLGVVGSLLAL